MKNNHKPKPRGGKREGSGRPPKPDKRRKIGNKSILQPGWAQLTVTLRQDTVDKLRAGAGSLFVGDFLQFHLDRNPLPTNDEYLEYKANLKLAPDFYVGKAASLPELTPEQKQRARLRRLFDRASPAERRALRAMYPKEVRDLVRQSNADQKLAG
jgi:hypothetical protein